MPTRRLKDRAHPSGLSCSRSESSVAMPLQWMRAPSMAPRRCPLPLPVAAALRCRPTTQPDRLTHPLLPSALALLPLSVQHIFRAIAIVVARNSPGEPNVGVSPARQHASKTSLRATHILLCCGSSRESRFSAQSVPRSLARAAVVVAVVGTHVVDVGFGRGLRLGGNP